MSASHHRNAPQWGFVSPEGFFQPIRSLSARGLEFVSRSIDSLEAELHENVQLERYEICALLRDELAKRRCLYPPVAD
jgi:hypothetical protein